ncbi:MAG TPA: hypothetical protein VGG02_13435 [Chthoniobacterales bacterium]|jgi:hypothetical protein
MTDYFALLGEARRPWLEPEELKEKYHAQARAGSPNEELNEAFRVLSEPRLRLQHLLALEKIETPAGRAIPPEVAELFWRGGNVLRETESWLRRNAEASGQLARAMLHPQRLKLNERLTSLESGLNASHEATLGRLQTLDARWATRAPNDAAELIEIYDSLSYLARLRERAAEKRLQLELA